MSKRQRFFVELREDEVCVSWTELVADAERAAAAAAAPSNANVPKNLKTAENSLVSGNIELGCGKTFSISPHMVVLRSSFRSRLLIVPAILLVQKTRRKLKLQAPPSQAAERTRQGSSIGDRNMNSSRELQRREDARKQKADVKMIEARKDEFDAIAKQVGAKGEVHRPVPTPCASGGAKTSCRTQKKAKACFCCSTKSNRT